MSHQNQAFTLIELMIAVAIVGILAAMATIGFERYIYEARLSALQPLVTTIYKNQIAFYHRPRLTSNGVTELPGCFVAVTWNPSTVAYVAGTQSLPIPMHTWDPDWMAIGLPTTTPVEFFFSSGPYNTSGTAYLPFCASINTTSPAMITKMQLNANTDIDRDRVLGYGHTYDIFGDGNGKFWLEKRATTNNPYE